MGPLFNSPGEPPVLVKSGGSAPAGDDVSRGYARPAGANCGNEPPLSAVGGVAGATQNKTSPASCAGGGAAGQRRAPGYEAPPDDTARASAGATLRAGVLGQPGGGLARLRRPWANVARVVANRWASTGRGPGRGAGSNAHFSLAAGPCLPARRTPVGFGEVPL